MAGSGRRTIDASAAATGNTEHFHEQMRNNFSMQTLKQRSPRFVPSRCQTMGLSLADFDISITPSFSKAGKTASASAVVRNVVKMAINSKNSAIKREQQDKSMGRSFQGMSIAMRSISPPHSSLHLCHLQNQHPVPPSSSSPSELASQYRSVSEEHPKVEKFFEDTGRGDEMCSSPRVSAHWRLKHDWEVDSAPTVFQRVVKWEEPDAAAMVKRPTGVELDAAGADDTEADAVKTIRPSPCFTAVPRGRRPAELFNDKDSIPPVGFYNPRETLVTPKTNISTKFLYPKVGSPRTPLSREQFHAQYVGLLRPPLPPCLFVTCCTGTPYPGPHLQQAAT